MLIKNFKISKGHNLIIEGQPSNDILTVDSPRTISFHPNSIKNFKTKLLVNEGDSIKVGTPLFYNKNNENVLFVSTCSGTIESIDFGKRRVVESININNDKKK